MAYVIVKMGNSPRPGVWTLERSLDGDVFQPWQYFVTHEQDCARLFGLPATPGRPHYVTDTDVICTTFFSKMLPIENAEVSSPSVN